MSAAKVLRAYLSGGMEFAKGEGTDWRKDMDAWLRDNLHHDVYNPNVESDILLARLLPEGGFRELKSANIGRYTEIVREFVKSDTREIAERTDYIVCNWDESAQRGAGTKGELTMAHFTHKPVYMVTTMPLVDIPGWVLGCTTKIFGSFDDVKAFLRSMYP